MCDGERGFRIVGGIVLAVAGLVGLSHGVEYSGWVVFVGLILVL